MLDKKGGFKNKNFKIFLFYLTKTASTFYYIIDTKQQQILITKRLER